MLCTPHDPAHLELLRERAQRLSNEMDRQSEAGDFWMAEAYRLGYGLNESGPGFNLGDTQ